MSNEFYFLSNSCLDVPISLELENWQEATTKMSSCKIHCALTVRVALCAPAPVFLIEMRNSDTF